MTEDPRCLNCNVPLRIILYVEDGRCVDTLACDARRKLLSHHGGGYILNPEGVTRIEPKKRE